ncbi:uncharacterized protein LOC110987534 isoform X2 [Acanthaster planci]|uniref:Uncharacterized protein LOC110987534 isoform X2 n=1 Tax=Acanthaster planci TaxID=133434 RepID=A0A8B7ZRT2_ACAPL|nr:uncharacterized protein LOC110987534 isoform X2 [Acanthaster planci]
MKTLICKKDVIITLLKYEIPLGDALIRAIDVEYEDAVKAICQYLSTNEDICREVLAASCDNDDFHPALTPLVLAAQKNSYNIVMLLLDLGAEIHEPTISLGGEVTLTQAISTLHLYRALSQPAYILATQTDVFGYAFAMTAKLQSLSLAWTDFGEELQQMARRVEVFAGVMLGKLASSGEILSVFGYHNTDKYRDNTGKQHQLSKMFEAIAYQQKEFVAHPHSQKAIITQFYKNLLSWNEQGFLYQLLLMLIGLLGYPIICLLYILFPARKVVRFARLPYVMLLMNTGSTFTFLALIIAATVVSETKYPQSASALYALIFIWVIGLAWRHIKKIMMHGFEEYLAGSGHILEAIIIACYVTVFFIQWNGQVNIISNVIIRRSSGDFTSYSDVQDRVESVLSSFEERLNTSVVEGVGSVLTRVLSNCSPVFAAEAGPPADDGPSLPGFLQETISYDQFEPVVVSHALFAVTVVLAFLRLMNLLLIIDSVGPLRISLGAMRQDIVKFCVLFVVIWLAFAIGLYTNYYSAGQSVLRECFEGGGTADDCSFLTGFETFLDAISSLYWSLFGMIELDVLMLSSKHSVAEVVGTFMFVMYHIMVVLVMLNALIGMLSNTYNITEENADTEWKFHRTAVWASYLRPVGTLPPPFNLIPSVKSLIRLCRYILGIWLKCAKRKSVNRRERYSKKEFAAYVRVLKLTRDRYVQDHLSATSSNSEEVRPRDIQALRNDVMTFRFYTQDRLESLNKMLDLSNLKSSDLSHKLEDLDPLSDKSSEVVQQAVELKDNCAQLIQASDNLMEEQAGEIVSRDEEAAELRAKIATLQAEAQQLVVDHAAELAVRERQRSQLTGIIRKLEEEKAKLADDCQTLRRDKAELINTVGMLLEETDKLKLEIPEPTEEQPEEQPEEPEQEQPQRVGFIRRIVQMVEKKINETMGDASEDGVAKETETASISEDDTLSTEKKMGEGLRSETGEEQQAVGKQEDWTESGRKKAEKSGEVSKILPPSPSVTTADPPMKESLDTQDTTYQKSIPTRELKSKPEQMPFGPNEEQALDQCSETILGTAQDIQEQPGSVGRESQAERDHKSVLGTEENTKFSEETSTLPDADTIPKQPDIPEEQSESLAGVEVSTDLKETPLEPKDLPTEVEEMKTEETVEEVELAPVKEEKETPSYSDPTGVGIPKRKLESTQESGMDIDAKTSKKGTKPKRFAERSREEDSSFEEISLPPSLDSYSEKDDAESRETLLDPHQKPHRESMSEPDITPAEEQDLSPDPNALYHQFIRTQQKAKSTQEPGWDVDSKTPERGSEPKQIVGALARESGSPFEEIDMPPPPPVDEPKVSEGTDKKRALESTQNSDLTKEPQQELEELGGEPDVIYKSEELDSEEKPVIWQL